jgi:hypothetical protein
MVIWILGKMINTCLIYQSIRLLPLQTGTSETLVNAKKKDKLKLCKSWALYFYKVSIESIFRE